jgi:uncharacterized DUF497 family protein
MPPQWRSIHTWNHKSFSSHKSTRQRDIENAFLSPMAYSRHLSLITFWYTNGMEFEYDENKSYTNKQKHGIDFEDAQRLWQDESLLEVPLRFPKEARYLCIGKIGTKHWSAVITYRSHTIRIISVRRSRKEEIMHYEND